MTHHRLQLNVEKTEVFVITTLSSASKHSLTDVVIGDNIIQLTTVSRNIGVTFDSELSMKSQVSKLCQVAYLSTTSDSLHQRLLDTTLPCHVWTMKMVSFMMYLICHWTSCKESRMWQLLLWSEPVAMTTSQPSYILSIGFQSGTVLSTKSY